MIDFNIWTITGRMTKDPLDISKGETRVAALSLASNRRVKVGSEWQDEALFVDVTAFAKTADFILNNCKKGQPLLVSGEGSLRKWEKDGRSGVSACIKADKVQALSRPAAKTTGEEAPF